MATTAKRNIYQKISEVHKAVGYVKKDTEVGFGNSKYKGVTHDAVLNKTRAALVNEGIVVSASQVGKGECIDGVTKTGTKKIRFEALYEVAFINIDDPADRHVVTVEAHAEDSNDKAPGKAVSYATKTAMLKVLLLETGEDDEQRMEESVATPSKSETDILREFTACTSQEMLELVAADNSEIIKALGKKSQDNIRASYKELRGKFEQAA